MPTITEGLVPGKRPMVPRKKGTFAGLAVPNFDDVINATPGAIPSQPRGFFTGKPLQRTYAPQSETQVAGGGGMMDVEPSPIPRHPLDAPASAPPPMRPYRPSGQGTFMGLSLPSREAWGDQAVDNARWAGENVAPWINRASGGATALSKEAIDASLPNTRGGELARLGIDTAYQMAPMAAAGYAQAGGMPGVRKIASSIAPGEMSELQRAKMFPRGAIGKPPRLEIAPEGPTIGRLKTRAAITAPRPGEVIPPTPTTSASPAATTMPAPEPISPRFSDARPTPAPLATPEPIQPRFTDNLRETPPAATPGPKPRPAVGPSQDPFVLGAKGDPTKTGPMRIEPSPDLHSPEIQKLHPYPEPGSLDLPPVDRMEMYGLGKPPAAVAPAAPGATPAPAAPATPAMPGGAMANAASKTAGTPPKPGLSRFIPGKKGLGIAAGLGVAGMIPWGGSDSKPGGLSPPVEPLAGQPPQPAASQLTPPDQVGWKDPVTPPDQVGWKDPQPTLAPPRPEETFPISVERQPVDSASAPSVLSRTTSQVPVPPPPTSERGRLSRSLLPRTPGETAYTDPRTERTHQLTRGEDGSLTVDSSAAGTGRGFISNSDSFVSKQRGAERQAELDRRNENWLAQSKTREEQRQQRRRDPLGLSANGGGMAEGALTRMLLATGNPTYAHALNEMRKTQSEAELGRGHLDVARQGLTQSGELTRGGWNHSKEMQLSELDTKERMQGTALSAEERNLQAGLRNQKDISENTNRTHLAVGERSAQASELGHELGYRGQTESAKIGTEGRLAEERMRSQTQEKVAGMAHEAAVSEAERKRLEDSYVQAQRDLQSNDPNIRAHAVAAMPAASQAYYSSMSPTGSAASGPTQPKAPVDTDTRRQQLDPYYAQFASEHPHATARDFSAWMANKGTGIQQYEVDEYMRRRGAGLIRPSSGLGRIGAGLRRLRGANPTEQAQIDIAYRK